MTKPSDNSGRSDDAPHTNDDDGAMPDFMSQVQQFWAPLTQTLQEQCSHVEHGLAGFVRAHDDSSQRTREATNDMGTLLRASMDYGQTVGEQWMALCMAATRTAIRQVTPRA